MWIVGVWDFFVVGFVLFGVLVMFVVGFGFEVGWVRVGCVSSIVDSSSMYCMMWWVVVVVCVCYCYVLNFNFVM